MVNSQLMYYSFLHASQHMTMFNQYTVAGSHQTAEYEILMYNSQLFGKGQGQVQPVKNSGSLAQGESADCVGNAGNVC